MFFFHESSKTCQAMQSLSWGQKSFYRICHFSLICLSFFVELSLKALHFGQNGLYMKFPRHCYRWAWGLGGVGVSDTGSLFGNDHEW